MEEEIDTSNKKTAIKISKKCEKAKKHDQKITTNFQ